MLCQYRSLSMWSGLISALIVATLVANTATHALPLSSRQIGRRSHMQSAAPLIYCLRQPRLPNGHFLVAIGVYRSVRLRQVVVTWSITDKRCRPSDACLACPSGCGNSQHTAQQASRTSSRNLGATGSPDPTPPCSLGTKSLSVDLWE